MLNADIHLLQVLSDGYKPATNTSLKGDYSEKNNRSAELNMDFVKEQIQKLLLKGVIEKRDVKPTCVNPLSVSSRYCHETKKLKYRTVVDFSRHLNKQFKEFKTTLQDFRHILPRLTNNSFMCSFDLESAYHHIKLHIDFIEYCGFAVIASDGSTQYYVFLYLPFGLQPASFQMNNCTRPILTYCHDLGVCVSLYLDDEFNSDSSSDKCFVSYLFIIFIFQVCGWKINFSKSSQKPTQLLKYLGFFINTQTMKIYVSESKLTKIKNMISEFLQNPLKPVRCTAFAAMLGYQ